jgi:hypothetical protein
MIRPMPRPVRPPRPAPKPSVNVQVEWPSGWALTPGETVEGA